MEGILYVPYINTDLDDSNFEYKGPQLDTNNYLNILNDVSQNIIGGEYFLNHRNNMPNTVGFNANLKGNGYYSDQVSFYELPCIFFDDDGNDLNIDYLLQYYSSKESFMFTFSFNHDSSDEECLIELKSWISESKKVIEMPTDTYTEEMKIGLLPKRQFKIKIGKANAFLENCIFFDNYEDKVIIFVKEIIFYN